jgi:hypothetical protein
VAYDEALADRVRDLLAPREGLTERTMFGGIAFMVRGNMACGVSGRGGLMVRLGPEEYERALSEPGVRQLDMTGRPMRGWIVVAPEAVDDDESLASWVDAGADFATTLPPK